MFFDIYIIDGGQAADPVPAMLRKPIKAHLVIRRRFFNSPNRTLIAELYQSTTHGEAPLRQMVDAHFLAMNFESLMIGGRVGYPRRANAKSSVDFVEQRWVCKLPGAKVVVDAELLRRRSTDLSKAIQSDPFHPIWNDAPEQSTYGPLDQSIG